MTQTPGMTDRRFEAYYAELDPQIREQMLAELGDAAPEICRILRRSRYEFRRHPDRTADLWLWRCAFLPGLFRKRNLLRRTVRKELEAAIADFHLEDGLDEQAVSHLYWEMRNAVRRYLSTCSSPKYAASFFGLKKATPAEQKERACEDIWRMSRGLSLAAKMPERLKLWSSACHDELVSFWPETEEHYRALEAAAGV